LQVYFKEKLVRSSEYLDMSEKLQLRENSLISRFFLKKNNSQVRATEKFCWVYRSWRIKYATTLFLRSVEPTS